LGTPNIKKPTVEKVGFFIFGSQGDENPGVQPKLQESNFGMPRSDSPKGEQPGMDASNPLGDAILTT
jgi:hypothetical protein